MMAGVENRPRGRRQAHPANIKIREPRAPLIENMLDPGQAALARFRISFVGELFNEAMRQAVDFDKHEALRARRGRNRSEAGLL